MCMRVFIGMAWLQLHEAQDFGFTWEQAWAGHLRQAGVYMQAGLTGGWLLPCLPATAMPATTCHTHTPHCSPPPHHLTPSSPSTLYLTTYHYPLTTTYSPTTSSFSIIK